MKKDFDKLKEVRLYNTILSKKKLKSMVENR